jgi:hypothetical protein
VVVVAGAVEVVVTGRDVVVVGPAVVVVVGAAVVVVVGAAVVVVVGSAVVVVVGSAVVVVVGSAVVVVVGSAVVVVVGASVVVVVSAVGGSDGGGVVSGDWQSGGGAFGSGGGWFGSVGQAAAPAVPMPNGTDLTARDPPAPTSTAPVTRATLMRRWAADVDTGISDPRLRGRPGGMGRRTGSGPPAIAGAAVVTSAPDQALPPRFAGKGRVPDCARQPDVCPDCPVGWPWAAVRSGRGGPG